MQLQYSNVRRLTMATRSFGNTFKITTKYGKTNFKKAMENSTLQKEEKTIDIEKHMADASFIKKFMKNF
jgi:hypothetical protein